MDEVDFDDWAKKQAKDAFIVTYCSCPQDRAGASAALRLRELGFSNGFVLEGGIEAWRNAHAAGKDAK
jgi:rhodanese-related sulfurtransferase